MNQAENKNQTDNDVRLFDVLPRYFTNNLKIRKQDTKNHYYRCVRQFSSLLGRDAMLSDLTDENVTAYIRSSLEEGQTEATANQRTKQLRALWEWAARKRLVFEFPGSYKVPEPDRQPVAYTKDELRRLFESCAEAKGWIGPHRASTWWLALHWILLDTAERITAVLAIQRSWIDVQNSTIRIPGEYRKGGLKAATYRLSDRTMGLINEMLALPTETGLLFDKPWKDWQCLYKRYQGVYKRAGLEWKRRKTGFHKIRVTVATMLEINGEDAQKFLMHSSRSVTETSYIDAAQVLANKKPIGVGFDPEKKVSLLGRLFGR